ncbi:MAG TPA: hypothetical protein VFB45_05475 [Pseudolabrys sp.]|nr:hypothetical protein [Pseudolabrys sp.]
MSSGSTTVAAGRRPAGKLVRFVLTVAVATVLGPLIGGIVFALVQIFQVSGFEQGALAQAPITLDDIKGLLFVVMRETI